MRGTAQPKPVRSLTNVRTTTTKSRQFGASNGPRGSIASSTAREAIGLPGKLRKASQMNKHTSILIAAVASLVVGLGFATAGNAQSPTRPPMGDQDYCQSLVKAFHESIGTLHEPPVGVATAVALAQCQEGEPGPAIPVLEQQLRDRDVTVPPRD